MCIHTYIGSSPGRPAGFRLALGGTTCLTLLVWYGLVSFVCTVCSVKAHHKLLPNSQRLKNTCVRQVVLDRRCPLIALVV